MKIILDAMSGVNAPQEAVLGAMDAMKHFDIEISLIGREEAIRDSLKKNGIEELPAGMHIVPSGGGVKMEESIIDLLLRRRDCSLLTGLRMLSQENSDALVSSVSIDGMLTGNPFREEIHVLLKQAAEQSLVTLEGNVLIKSLGDTGVFVGSRIKQMLLKNGCAVRWLLRSKSTISEWVQLANSGEIVRMMRVRKPVILIPCAADRLMFHNAIEQILQTAL